MFKSGSNNRGVAEVKDIMATGKRSQVARLVLWTFIHTFSGYLLNFRKIFSSGNVCWHRPGSHRMWQGFRWNFVLYMKLVVGELACDNSHFSCSSPLAMFCEEERLQLSDRNSILVSDISQCLHIKNLVQSLVPKSNLFNFTFLLVDLEKCCVHLPMSSSKTQTQYIPQILTVLS